METVPIEFDPFRSGEIARTAPCTEPQKEIIASACMGEQANTAFNEGVSLRVSGRIDPGVIEAALRAIVGRHDALRTTFAASGGELCVTDRNDFVLERIDLGVGDGPAQEARIHALWRELASTPMNLYDGSLFRAIWLQLGEELGELILLAHHVVCDGWSFHVILEELSQLCSGGKAEELADAPSFADFAERQSAYAAANADVDYWLKRFEARPPVLDLPTDRARPAFRSFAAARVDHVFNAELAKSIASAAGKLKASVVNVALAGTAALLHRLTDATDMAIGLPVARQGMENLPGLVGHGVQLLPIRLQVESADRFQDVVSRAKSAILDAREHFDFTFGTLVRDLGMSGDPSRVPLVPVIFNIDQPFAELKLGAAVATLRTVPRTAENFEIFLNILPAQDRLMVEATFNTDLFSRDTISSWLSALENLLADAAADPAKSISALRLAAEHPDVYARLNDTVKAHPPGIWLDRLAEQVARMPKAVAVADSGGVLTYAELGKRSDELARALVRRGAIRNSLIGLYMTRSRELLVALTAIHKAGAAYVPLDPAFPESRLAFMLSDSGVRLLLTDIDLPDALKGAKLDVLRLPYDSTGDSRDVPLPAADSDDLAYVIYTSGSTGKPKGVEVRHGGVINFLDSMATRPGLSDRDTLLAVTTLSFDISVLELLLPLTRGARTIIATRNESVDARTLAAMLSSHDVTIMQATPSTWRLLLGDGWPGRSSLTAFCGGEPLPPDLAGALLGKVKALWNLYGPTETTIWSSCTRVESASAPITIGRPIDNTVIYVMDEGGQALPAGVPGEICIGGAGLARGYHARPELNAERFIVHPEFGRLYRTGDRGRVTAAAAIEHFGRLDFQVKIRGYRIELGEIEAALESYPGISQAVVVTREDQQGDVRLVAHVVARTASEGGEDALRAHLRMLLPEYMVPQHFVFLPLIPLLPSGKVDRRSLPAPAIASATATRVAPVNDLERMIASEMEACLGVNGIGVHDSFFVLGGHSLLATRLLIRLEKATGIRLPMRAIFEAPTVSGLAARLQLRSAQADAAHTVHAAIPRRASREAAPLSLSQQGIWLQEQLVPGRAMYNLPSGHRLRGKLDETAFEKAFLELIRRQEVLRTGIEMMDGALSQIVLPSVDARLLPAVDLRGMALAEREKVLSESMDQLSREPFDLNHPPLFRARLYRLDEAEYVFCLVTHHIIWDGGSYDLLYGEMAALYEAFRERRPSPLPELPVTYGDYAAWQREKLQGEVLAAELGYWKQALGGVIEPLAVPEDFPRPAVQSGDNGTVYLSIPGAVVERLRGLARGHDATIFMGLLAVYAVTLSQFTGQKDVVIGTFVKGRHAPELEPVMGLFVQAVPLHIRLPENAGFRQVLGCVRDCVVTAFQYTNVPLDVLVRELGLKRDESRFPVYQASLSYQDGRERILRWGDLEHEYVTTNQPMAGADIGIWFLEQPGAMIGALAYNTDILSEASARLLGERFLHNLNALLSFPEADVSSLPLAEPEHRLLFAWNATSVATDPKGRAHTHFEAQARRSPDRVAVRCGGSVITYRALDQQANRLAHALRARGVHRGSHVGLHLERSMDMVTAVLAVLKCGAAYVPLDPGYPAGRLSYMAEDAALALVLTDAPLPAEMVFPVDRTLNLREGAADLARRPAEPVEPADGKDALGEDPAYMIYTSGSTGRPKGVRVPHRAVVNFLASMQHEPGLGPEDRLLAVTTLSFDISVLELLLPLSVGAEVVLATREESMDGFALQRLLAASEANVMQATPATWRMLMDAGWRGGPQFTALCGGEALSTDLAKALLERTGALWNMYGPTETTVWSTCARITGVAAPLSIGKPIANTSVYVLDEHRHLCPIGVAGEIYIGGEGVALGYWNRPEMNAERFVADPFSGVPGARLYRTGDRGRWRAEGVLEHMGRLDHQVKVRGYRIEPGEIEARLTAHPDVARALVIVREDQPGDPRVVAYLVMRDAATMDTGMLRTHLRLALPDYMVPQHFLALPAIPRLPNGKVDRHALPSPAAQGLDAAGDSEYVAPRNDLEIGLVSIWERVLGRPRVGIRDSFFDLGGHSLLLVQLTLEIRKTTGIDISLGQVFQFPTIEGLIDSLGPGVERQASVLVPLQRQGEGIPIFCLVGVNLYREFARNLGMGQPVYGVYATEEQALVDKTVKGVRPDVSIEKLVDAYYHAIVRFRPHGPYRLAGLSFGGVVAMEVASRLRKSGEVVDVVFLFDTLLPHGYRRNYAKWAAGKAADILKGDGVGVYRSLIRRVRRRLAGNDSAAGAQAEMVNVREAAAIRYAAFYQAMEKWEARNLVSDFPVVLFRATDQSERGSHVELDEDYGWRRFVGDHLSMLDVPGDHLSMMDLPNVLELSRKARQYLAPAR